MTAMSAVGEFAVCQEFVNTAPFVPTTIRQTDAMLQQVWATTGVSQATRTTSSLLQNIREKVIQIIQEF